MTIRRFLQSAFVLSVFGLTELAAAPAAAQVGSGWVNAPVVSFPTVYIDGTGAASGPIRLTDGTAAAPSLPLISLPTYGLFRAGGNQSGLSVTLAGVEKVRFDATWAEYSLTLGANVALAFTGATLGASATVPDLIFRRDAANTFAQRNGTNAQTFQLYNTFTDASNYERFSAGWAGNVLTIGSEIAGTGSSRTVKLSAAGTAGNLILATNTTDRWSVGASTGHFLAALDNTYDIGASGATRPRDEYLGRNLYIGGIVPVYNGVNTAGQGIPYTVGTTGLLSAQGANITTTNIVASVANGLYEVCAFIAVTRAATTSSTMPSVTIGWNNGTAANTFLWTATSTGNSLTTQDFSCRPVHAGAATALTYATNGFASSGGTSMQYELWVTARAIY